MRVTLARVAALVLVGASCARQGDDTWHAAAGYRWRSLDVPRGAAGFRSMLPARTGVRFQNTVSERLLTGNRVLGQGAGVSLGDIDGDGRADIFLARTDGCSALYRNEGDWSFEDITRDAHVGVCDRHTTGTAMADVDGDGDLDLVLLATDGPDAIFINDGRGRFSERAESGLDRVARGATTLTMADVDGSGRLALFVANYKPFSIDDSIPPQRRAFNQMVREIGPGKFEIVPEHRSEYKLVMRPDMGGLRMTQRAEPNGFYLNDGRGHFTAQPMSGARFLDASGLPTAAPSESFALSGKFIDLNADGAPDLLVSNDFEDTDELWYNDGHGNFRLADWKAMRQMSNSSMGLDAADINGDGLPDVFETDMLANDARRIKTQIPTHSTFPKKPGEMQLQLQDQQNTLFVNRGDGTFGEVAQMAGVTASGWSWGTMFMDVDLDGFEDILIANGHLWDIMDADVQEGLQSRLNDVPWQRVRWLYPPLRLHNVALRNRGDMTFVNADSAWHFGSDEDISHAIASADLDGDGDLDVVINRLGSPALLLRNDSPAPRVAVRLNGRAPNTRAVGAVVQLRGGATPLQSREVAVGGLYMSHSDYLASFAMRESKRATLVITWRDGAVTTIDDVQPDREYEVDEPAAGTAPVAAEHGARVATAAQDAAHRPLFEDVTAQLGGHVHTEDTFDDWDRQFLLPSALSQLGPGLAWFDYDQDGAEDLLVGTGQGGRIGVFHNERGALVPQVEAGPAASRDYTTLLGFTDRGRSRLLVGVSTWESRNDAERIAQPSVIGFGFGSRTAGASSHSASPLSASQSVVPSHESATGPLAMADYDGDGHLDLFVGSRALPMGYPQPVTSGLFHNVDGAFVLDTANSQLLRNIGMASAAVFADLTGDGSPELIIAREWGSIALFVNDGHGHYRPAPASWNLDRYTSRWNGIAAGDVNGDGRLDLVATSWGRNIATPADSSHPLQIVYGAFGARGETEMLWGRGDTRVGGIAPFNSYARVRTAVPSMLSRFTSFAAYAGASIEQVAQSTNVTTQRLEARTMDNMVFLNEGGRFEATPLPAEAQWAPAFYAGIADFDGDGQSDVFLAQNFSPTSVAEPRYDAGRSLLLKGDGKGGFTPMSGAMSGITVYGDGRGAGYADFNGDGRLDLAVSQNGAATRLFANREAKPGLRVRLIGPPSNPAAIGAQLRVEFDSSKSPVQEISLGSGYWSQNRAIQLFGVPSTPRSVWVRWPGGRETRASVPAGASTIFITSP